MNSESLAQWLERLETLHPNAMELGLERVSAVARSLELLPVEQPVVTIAGTNGKGSTVAVLEAILSETGLLTGAFTSPHLLRFNERIRVGGVDASDEEIVAAFESIERARGQISLTYFEFAALAALLIFRRRTVQVLVLEVGLGGNLDAVNMVDAAVAVITSIDLDHQAWLGDDRGSISREKAGILRAGRPAVIADPLPPPELIESTAAIGADPVLLLGREFKVQPHGDGDDWQGLLRTRDGQQRMLPRLARSSLEPANVCAALQAALMLGVGFSDHQLLQALAVAQPRGRCELLQVAGLEYVLDVAHNPAAVHRLVEFLNVTPCKGRTIALFSVMSDKDVDGMIQAAWSNIDAWFLADQPANSRAAMASDVAAALHAKGQTMVSISKNIRQALRRAQRVMTQGDRLVVFGSFYTVADVIPLLDVEPPGLETICFAERAGRSA